MSVVQSGSPSQSYNVTVKSDKVPQVAPKPKPKPKPKPVPKPKPKPKPVPKPKPKPKPVPKPKPKQTPQARAEAGTQEEVTHEGPVRTSRTGPSGVCLFGHTPRRALGSFRWHCLG